MFLVINYVINYFCNQLLYNTEWQIVEEVLSPTHIDVIANSLPAYDRETEISAAPVMSL